MGGKTSKGQSSGDKEGKTNEALQDLTKNKKWVQQMKEYFDAVDLNKNGYTSQLRRFYNEVFEDFYGAAGLLPGKQVTKEEFLEGVSHLSVAELEKKKLGEETLMESLCNAFYKAMDRNDDGKITVNEVKTIMKACNMTEEKAEKWFNLADKNKNGVVETHELTNAEFESWFCPEPEEDNTE
ncbi:obelin-like [Paramuricea clavata]|uniref:Obelin-like n=1 Tax=Paramuricea clavata TaxID=317549 RepID=A0A6S7HNT5_PARCT|nr:obelin-like [Paramuricea clavata]